MGRYRYARAFFHDLIYLAANVPLIVYAIVAIIVFGISGMGPTSVVVLFRPARHRAERRCGDDVRRPRLGGNEQGVQPKSGRNLAKARDHPHRDARLPLRLDGCRSPTRGSSAALVETFGGSKRRGLSDRPLLSFVFSVRDVLAWMCFFVIFVVLLEAAGAESMPSTRLFRWRAETRRNEARAMAGRSRSRDDRHAGRQVRQ